MDKAEFKKQSLALCQWAAGNLKENAPVFFVNGYLGHDIQFYEGQLTIHEADNGGLNYSGEAIYLTADQVEEMSFDEDGGHDGQGYDIEVYQLERMEFPHGE